MKFVKTSLAVALLSLGSLAAAESQITLYGTVDGAVVVNKAKGADTTVSMEDGIAGGSVWGLEGTEDLGNGYSVGFLLENGFSMDSGKPVKEARVGANKPLCPFPEDSVS